jgi:hypothetical protein
MLRMRLRSGGATSSEGGDAKGVWLPTFCLVLEFNGLRQARLHPWCSSAEGGFTTHQMQLPMRWHRAQGEISQVLTATYQAEWAIALAVRSQHRPPHVVTTCRDYRLVSLCCCRMSAVAGFHVWWLGRASQCSGSPGMKRRHQREEAAGACQARAGCAEHSQGAGDLTSKTMTQCRNYAVSVNHLPVCSPSNVGS